MSDTNTDNYEPIDFTTLKMERGSTPDDIDDKCLQLCKDYLGGTWLKVTTNEIVVNRLSGGLTNQIYYCAINEDKRTTDAKEAQEVVIRFYQDKHFNTIDNLTDERLPDTVIGLLVSENGLGPKILGIFDGGQIQKYYKVIHYYQLVKLLN